MTQLNDEELRRLENEKDERLQEYVKLMRKSLDGDHEAKESAQHIYQAIKKIEGKIAELSKD
jgi:hypothetical protein